MSLAELAHDLGARKLQLRYHLFHMERLGIIRSDRTEGRKRYTLTPSSLLKNTNAIRALALQGRLPSLPDPSNGTWETFFGE